MGQNVNFKNDNYVVYILTNRKNPFIRAGGESANEHAFLIFEINRTDLV